MSPSGTAFEDDLRDRLAGALAVTDAGDLVRDAVVGGRRRLRRRRWITTAGATLCVVSLVAAVAVRGSGPVRLGDPAAGRGDYYAHLLDQPTRGNLADDEAFVESAVTTWEETRPESNLAPQGILDDVRSDPHVVWAGAFDGGRAVAVAQAVEIHPRDEFTASRTGPTTVLGYLVQSGDDWVRVGDTFAETRAVDLVGTYGAVLGDEGPVLLLDEGPAQWSTAWDYEEGPARRIWSPVVFEDGAALLDIPEGDPLWNLAVTRIPMLSGVRVDGAAADFVGVVMPDNHEGRPIDPLGWGWRAVDLTTGAVDDSDEGYAARQGEWHQVFDALLPAALGGFALDAWVVEGVTPDGRSIHVVSSSHDADPTRVRVVLDLGGPREEIVDGGLPVTSDTGWLPPLPVQVQLPDGQGWLVANLDPAVTVRWRVDGGPWNDTVGGAALLPDVPGLSVEVVSDTGTLEAVLTSP